MNKPADPATPFGEVYQQFLAVLKKHGRKQSTLDKYLYDFIRFERWLKQTARPATMASLVDPPNLGPVSLQGRRCRSAGTQSYSPGPSARCWR